MSKPGILIVTKKFPPYGGMGVMRVLRMVRALDAAGFGTVVLTSSPPPGTLRIDHDLMKSIPQNTRVVRSHIFSFGGASRLVTRFIAPDKKSDWIPTIVYRGLQIIRHESVGAVLATASPFSVFVGAASLANRTSVPLILDYRDMWFWETGQNKTRFDRSNEKLEAYAMEASSSAITVMKSMEETLKLRYPGKWIETVYNAYDDMKFHGYSHIAPDTGDPKRIISQIGTLSGGLIEAGFFDVLDQILSGRPEWEQRLKLRFIGKSPKRMAQELGARWEKIVEFIPQVPHHEALRLMAESHGLLLFRPWKKTFSGKIAEYIGMGRPILAVCHPDNEELAGTLTPYGPGYFADMQDASAYRAVTERFLADLMNDRFQAPNPGVVEQFSTSFQDRRFIEIVEKAVQG